MASPAPLACIAVSCAFVALRSAPAGCDPPPNETCAGQIVFSTGDLPYTDSGVLGCVNDEVDKPYYDIFYRYDCTLGGPHLFSLCDSGLDTYIRIYVNGCGWADGDEFAVGDDECPGSPPNADPEITVELDGGTSYWIEIGNWRPDLPWGEPNLPFQFTVSFPSGAPCTGDVNGDGSVDVLDFLELLANWGSSDPVYDLDASGAADIVDLLLLLANWGSCR